MLLIINYIRVLSYYYLISFFIEIEADLAYAGLNSAHVGRNRLNKPAFLDGYI